MSDPIDLTKKYNRVILALDIFLGTVFFSECYPTEPASSYFWRTQRQVWIDRVDGLFGRGHCYESFSHSQQHAFDAPEYRL